MTPDAPTTPDAVARIVLLRDDWTTFIQKLKESASALDEPGFETTLAAVLRAKPDLIERWSHWSEDQRWSPSAALMGRQVVWVRSDVTRCHRVDHDDEASAAADFVHRVSVWWARREVLKVGN